MEWNVVYLCREFREHFKYVLLGFHGKSALHDAEQKKKSSRPTSDPSTVAAINDEEGSNKSQKQTAIQQ